MKTIIANIMSFLKKPYIIAGLLAIGLAGALYVKFVSPTNVAFINFTDSQYAQILEVKKNAFINAKRISFKQEKTPGLKKYTAIYIFGMGLNLNEKQSKSIQAAMNRGSKVYVYAATSSGSDLNNLEGDDLKYIEACFSNGGRRNMQALLNYSRRIFDGKTFFSQPIVEPQIIPHDVFFHLGEDEYFTTHMEYQEFYETRDYFKPEGAKVCILTTNLGPRNRNNRAAVDALIRDLEARGMNVYPAAGFMQRLDFLKAVNPDLAVLMPHGRLALGRAAEAVAYLREKNIPLLCPIHIFGPYDKWVKSQQGMAGGMLSQSIVMPELDGGIDPYVIGAQFKNKNGLYVFKPIPERIKRFGRRVENWIRLQRLPNSEKKVAIVYYKGPGLNAMSAGGLEVAPSLLNLLRHLKQQGFDTGVLPENAKALMARIQKEGPVLGAYAKGSFQKYLENGNPELISVPTYSAWCQQNLQPEMLKDIEVNYGPEPGKYRQVEKDDEDYIAVARIRFGNVVILPQPLPGYGDNTSQIIHGAKKAPPHAYVAAYLWIKNGFKADAIVHFGTHGSLEFTPWKQVALSQYDWPDALIGALPHPYIYVINNIGEAMIAKRRSYAVIASHLTPPFTEADLYGKLSDLHNALHSYFNTESKALKQEYRETIKTLVYKMELHKDLELEGKEKGTLAEAAIHKIHNHIHVLEQEKITRGLYTLGKSYRESDVYETVRLMAIDAIAYSRAGLDLLQGKIKAEDMENQHKFDTVYRQKAFAMIDNILLRNYSPASYLNKQDLARLAAWDKAHAKPGPDEMMRKMSAAHKTAKTDSREEEYVAAVRIYRDTLFSIKDYYAALEKSTSEETAAIVRALSGGYLSPSSGGDPIGNPQAVPTGRNLYAIDAEKTPTQEAWKVGVKLADALIAAKLSRTGKYPQKAAFTLWGGEFIRAQGINLAQIFYLLGVEPVRNSRGAVHDVRLIPMEKLKRPRIDVVVQTSGQFRDIAASRVYLINKAVDLAGRADDGDQYENHVKAGTIKAEAIMKAKGLSPEQARKFATARVFGGVNGNYGTAIMGKVESGDKWEDEKEIIDQYLKNMGAVYTKENWGFYQAGIFEGALQNTDTVVHPRSSNTYGPLSLDHYYEFMGGLNAVVRQVTGSDPEAFFNDLRNRYNPRVQGVKEAIWVEARTTIFNPKYIKDLQAGGASSAEVFAETVRNTYGWNVMKPNAIDKEIWEGIDSVYIQDKYKLNMEKYFRQKNPYALQEITAVMLETIRKGYWQPDAAVIKRIAELHARLVIDHKAGCSGFVCDNAKLQAMIQNALKPEQKADYKRQIDSARMGETGEKKKGMELKKEKMSLNQVKELVKENMTTVVAVFIILLLFSAAVIVGMARHRK